MDADLTRNDVMIAAGHGGQADISQAQFVPLQAIPLLDPVAVPVWHAPLAMHQPQPARAAHDPHVVLVLHASVAHAEL